MLAGRRDSRPRSENLAKRQIPRQSMPEQPADTRRHNFDEVTLGYDEETAVAEASRCLACKNKPCVAGCPVEIDIPGFINRIRERDIAGAIRIIKESNCLPAICGRVCPQEVQCEQECVLGKKGEPVAVGRLERFAADWEARQNAKAEVAQAAPTGKRAAVIGSGPGGLTVAAELARRGHAVTVFEAFHKPGGVLVYGIPEFRLPKSIVEREVDFVRSLGVEVRTNVVVGRTLTINELFEQGYDAVFVGVGAGLPAFLNIPGENLLQVYSANEYLTRANLMKAYLEDYDTPLVRGGRVVVVGGGNVAMDSARTAMRMGADEVRLVYRRSRTEMPARAEEVEHAEQEGIIFELLTNPTRIFGNDETRVKAIECIRMELGEPDDSGRRRPVPTPGSEFRIDVDTVVIAIGNKANPLLPKVTPGMDTNKRGYIIADPETGRTTREGVYAGGDIVTGAATVILAMGAGLCCARAMHEYMMSR
ncbi:MAG: NADPH-dependent glutamate synthase [Planctomycetota bacterium]